MLFPWFGKRRATECRLEGLEHLFSFPNFPDGSTSPPVKTSEEV